MNARVPSPFKETLPFFVYLLIVIFISVGGKAGLDR